MSKIVTGAIAFLVACLAITVIFTGLPNTVNAAANINVGDTVGWSAEDWLVGVVAADTTPSRYNPTDSALYQLPATRGKISWFYCRDSNSPAAWGELLGEKLGTDKSTKYWYCAMRWPYAEWNHELGKPVMKSTSAKKWWHDKKILVTNPKNGEQVVLAAKDWGPNPNTGRVIDVSQKAIKSLGADTDDTVNIAFAPQNAALGTVQPVIPPPEVPKQNLIQEVIAKIKKNIPSIQGVIGTIQETISSIRGEIWKSQKNISFGLGIAAGNIILFVGAAITGLIFVFLVRFLARAFFHSGNILSMALSFIMPIGILVFLYYLYEEEGMTEFYGGVLGVIIGIAILIGRLGR